MAKLYGNVDSSSVPYLALMHWHSGWFSAPHPLLHHRISVPMVGIWRVSRGRNFAPD